MSQIKKQLNRQFTSGYDLEEIMASVPNVPVINPVPYWNKPVSRIPRPKLQLEELQPADKMRLEAARGLDLSNPEPILGIKWRNRSGRLPAIHEYNQAVHSAKLVGSVIHQRIAIIAN